VAVQVASIFNSLLDALRPLTEPIHIDTRFALITSEPNGCSDCALLIEY